MPKMPNDKTLKDPLIAAEEGGSSSVVPRSKEPSALNPLVHEDGLSTEQADELRKQWGPNALPENKKSKLMLLLKILIKQLLRK